MGGSHNGPKFRQRYAQAKRFIAPTLQRTGRPLSQLRALEVGCGECPKLCALAPLFKEYVGIDLDPVGIELGKANAWKYGIKNADIRLQSASDLPKLLSDQTFDVVILYAVLEHLTIEERLATLQMCWDALPDTGLLYIGEAPNRVSPMDYHSSTLPHFNTLPPELAAKLMDRSPRAKWRKRVLSEDSVELGLYRNGMHVGYEEFDLSLFAETPMQNHVLVDNWSVDMLNLYPLRWFELRNLDDFDLMQAQGFAASSPAPMFGRYWIEGILSKAAVPHLLQRPTAAPTIWEAERPSYPSTLGTPERTLAPHTSLRIDHDGTAGELLLGLTDKSTGSFTLSVGQDALSTYSVQDIRAANAGLWDIQSWLSIPLPEGPQTEIVVTAQDSSWLTLLPPMIRPAPRPTPTQ